MRKFIYLLCHRDNVSGKISEVAYSSKRKAMDRYETIRDKQYGLPVNFIIEEDMEHIDHIPTSGGMIDLIIAHCFMGDKNGNTHYHSYYVIKKEIF